MAWGLGAHNAEPVHGKGLASREVAGSKFGASAFVVGFGEDISIGPPKQRLTLESLGCGF